MMAERPERAASSLPSAHRSKYRQALAEFDRLWETGESKRWPHRMRELLVLIEAAENASHVHSIEGVNNAVCNA
jgi:hypothetical protein